MLHESEPAVVGLLHVIGFALVEIRQVNLLVLVLVRVHAEADEALRAEG
jgi:hypothetical protein